MCCGLLLILGMRGGSVPMVMVQKVQQPATLFGGAPMRTQVACQVHILSIMLHEVVRCRSVFYLFIYYTYLHL